MERPLYSYRGDAAVPGFADDAPLVVFDGDCAFCSDSARRVLKHDRLGRFRLTPAQSALGRALLTHYGLDPLDPSTLVLVEDGRAWTRSDAVVRILSGLEGPIRRASVLRWLPRPVRDAAYDGIARRRRSLPGAGAWCAMPDQEQAARAAGRVIG